jgi:hypothetical protein
MREFFRDTEHLLRLAGVFGVGLLLFLGLRAVLVPEGFGLYGHYRPGALPDSRARDASFAGRQACADCHTDEPAALRADRHAGVGCESCHGALARHAADPEKQTPGHPDWKTLCIGCHFADAAKPAAFPQIVPKDHAEGPCIDCHPAHQPTGGGR